jgi:hypothetical protein
VTYFLRSGNTYRVSDEAALDLHELLPAGNYIIKQDQFGNLFLEETDRFKPLAKYYGDCLKHSERIHRTFSERPSSTGVMLTGEKGSGKTLLAKQLSILGYDLDIPTIVINNSWTGDAFNKFLADIDQPCIILFDEFEKVYDHHKQEAILTLLDGVFPSKKLFVLTCNDKWRIDQHMRNRPGRIFYMIDFKGLTTEFIIEYCNDNLIDKSYIEQITKIATLFTEFNFDMLKAMVEDMNRYGESPQEVMRLLNAKPEYDNRDEARFKVELFAENGKQIDNKFLYTKTWTRNPLSCNTITIELNDNDSDGLEAFIRQIGGDVDSDVSYSFQQSELINVNGATGTFEYRAKDGSRLKLTREKTQTFNYFGAL